MISNRYSPLRLGDFIDEHPVIRPLSDFPVEVFQRLLIAEAGGLCGKSHIVQAVGLAYLKPDLLILVYRPDYRLKKTAIATPRIINNLRGRVDDARNALNEKRSNMPSTCLRKSGQNRTQIIQLRSIASAIANVRCSPGPRTRSSIPRLIASGGHDRGSRQIASRSGGV